MKTELANNGLWSYHAGPVEEPADYDESCGKRKLEDYLDDPAATCPPNLPTLPDVNVEAPLSPHGDAPDAKRRAVEVAGHYNLIPKNRSDRDTSRCPHNDPVVKEEDLDDSFFVSQPRSSSTIASLSSPSSLSSFRRGASESISTESTPATPRPSPAPEPAHWQLTGDGPSCTCPIDLHCGVKEDHLIDCRPLVPEEENYWCQSKPGLIPEHLPCNQAGETFAIVEELTRMVQLCDEIMQEEPKTARSTSRHTAVVHRLQALTALLNRSSLHLRDLESSQVLHRLQDFLSPANEETVDKRIPRSLREDLSMLVRRWEVGDLCALPHRGLLRRRNRHQEDNGDDNNNDSSSNGTSSTGPSSWRVDPSWPWKWSAAVFGHGHCVNGQTWPNRLAMLRDGAHGRWAAGIHGNRHEGAYAIVMGLHLPKYFKYADVDFGETIYYIGTARKRASDDKQPTNIMDNPDDDNDNNNNNEEDNADRQPTDATKSLIKSRSTQLPVRVFRSSKASKLVPGRPKQGYRYDGLYRVVDYECLKVVRQIYRFEMKRLTNDEARKWGCQGPLRGWKVC